jgi:hypothetical protein
MMVEKQVMNENVLGFLQDKPPFTKINPPKMPKEISKRVSAVLLPPIVIRNQEKSTTEKRLPKEGSNFSQILITMGELCYEMRFT